jgi:hypothetical protein
MGIAAGRVINCVSECCTCCLSTQNKPVGCMKEHFINAGTPTLQEQQKLDEPNQESF